MMKRMKELEDENRRLKQLSPVPGAYRQARSRMDRLCLS